MIFFNTNKKYESEKGFVKITGKKNCLGIYGELLLVDGQQKKVSIKIIILDIKSFEY